VGAKTAAAPARAVFLMNVLRVGSFDISLIS
jgi:hypothetical protein